MKLFDMIKDFDKSQMQELHVLVRGINERKINEAQAKLASISVDIINRVEKNDLNFIEATHKLMAAYASCLDYLGLDPELIKKTLELWGQVSARTYPDQKALKEYSERK